MNRRHFLATAAALGAVYGVTPAFARDKQPYFGPEALPLFDLLLPPPPQDSETTKAEIEEIIKVMAAASQDRKDQAVADFDESLKRFLAVTPLKIDAATIPLTTALFERVLDTASTVTKSAKASFARPRPDAADPRIIPLAAKPGKAAKLDSYPSGHATAGMVQAVLLVHMMPEKKPELMARARDCGLSRIVAGVHYRSDLDAGYASGALIAQALLAMPAFVTDLEAAKVELRKAAGV